MIVRNRRGLRNGITLLEMVVAGTMITTIMMGMALVFRSAGQTWEMVDQDYAVERQLSSLVRHFVRESREAGAVVAISRSGRQITLLMNDGNLRTWRREPNGEVQFQMNTDAAFQTIATDIAELQFRGLDAAGIELTSDPNSMQLVEITATANRADADDSQLIHESTVWIRQW
ncbi:hypothetical protein [Roseiconus lacunae]|uniref:Prepilin-type N-terminal cleavage/methylation domain-containing protein n=1 Tax=Roseiconus lacunae TaxID=2605694 RepID=A0ABT7PJI3_9BACT|nr:hypothetical protein [Roseiconus lacunae]MCD0461725.1 hypothetical protein [Roseiconus lacunae]MDM4016630.1 hypothetical protein [Roseiconus lacunae]WRQ49498.1 hypothetical protein U8335_21380 [Stieleria sp. HD01]